MDTICIAGRHARSRLWPSTQSLAARVSGSALIFNYALVIVGGLLSFFSCIWGRQLAQQPTFVEIRSGYNATPVGVIEENVAVDVDYAELK